VSAVQGAWCSRPPPGPLRRRLPGVHGHPIPHTQVNGRVGVRGFGGDIKRDQVRSSGLKKWRRGFGEEPREIDCVVAVTVQGVEKEVSRWFSKERSASHSRNGPLEKRSIDLDTGVSVLMESKPLPPSPFITCASVDPHLCMYACQPH
jgi:hypothetical protein